MKEKYYCEKCLMPSTNPNILWVDSNLLEDKINVCQSCQNYEMRQNIDWKLRQQEFSNLCDKYRRHDGYYDCVIPVSGGKDSHRLVYTIKNVMGMNPLLVTVGDPFTKTLAGTNNLKNLSDTFGCDHIQFNINTDLFRRVTKLGFEKFAEPLRFVEAAIYTMPVKMAINYGIKFVIYGEDSAYEYGGISEERELANDYIKEVFNNIDIEYWTSNGISLNDLNSITLPDPSSIEKENMEIVFLSYFYPWSSNVNRNIAVRHGFQDLTHEWIREGTIDNFEQIDSVAYMVNIWLKYPKFGYQRVTDIVGRRIREEEMDVYEGKKMIIKHDHKLDQLALKDFVDFIGITTKEFWDIVEDYWNKNIFEKVDEAWRLKNKL